METLKIKYELTKKSIDSLKEIINMITEHKKVLHLDFVDAEKEQKVLRDSLIQRFEYSVDTLWNYLKEYFLEIKGVKQDSPKPIFRQCLKSGLTKEEETEKLLLMVDDRNLTTHTYKEELANEIAKNIPQYFELMEKVLEESKKDF